MMGAPKPLSSEERRQLFEMIERYPAGSTYGETDLRRYEATVVELEAEVESYQRTIREEYDKREALDVRVSELEAQLRSEFNNPTFVRCHNCCELMLADDVESRCFEPCKPAKALRDDEEWEEIGNAD